MKIVVSGATGFIGSALSNLLIQKNHKLVVLTRSQQKIKSNPNIEYVIWNPDSETEIIKQIDGADALINLAGEPIVGKRWSRRQKEEILTSRVNATKTIVHSIQKAGQKPKILINASAIGIYGSRGSEELTEDSKPGDDFLSKVCRAWEAHAIRAEDFGVRTVLLRTGIVLGKNGGALQKMLPPFRMGAGGWLGSGNQWMSWVHLDDLVGLILFALENGNVKGPLNGTAPQPVTNKAFSMVLAQTLKRPCLFPVPEFALKLLLGEMSVILLASQRVLPKKAKVNSFSFKYPDIRIALQSILK